MDLKLDLVELDYRGRPTFDPVGVVVRELNVDDLMRLTENQKTTAPALVKIGDRHHLVARLLAQGMKGTEISLRTGYSLGRISCLKEDPAFQDLLAFYQKESAAAFSDFNERLAGIAVDAVDALRDRMEESIEDIPTGQLIEIVKMGADRTGHGPQTSSTNVSVTMNIADRLDAARARAKAASRSIVDAEVIPPPKLSAGETS